MPASTSKMKTDQIVFYGGRYHFVDDPSAVHAAEHPARSLGGHYLDQFTYAERATDWRGNNNIADFIFRQIEQERYPVPTWIVVGAGTGGTSATIGRFIRYRGHGTRLCMVDPENSAFYDHFHRATNPRRICGGSGIEGIGRPRVEPSFIPAVIDRMIQVPNAASIAAMRYLERITARRYGASTGTDLWGTLRLIDEMEQRGERGSVVTMACDPGDRYLDTYYDDAWVATQGYDTSVYDFREHPATTV